MWELKEWETEAKREETTYKKGGELKRQRERIVKIERRENVDRENIGKKEEKSKNKERIILDKWRGSRMNRKTRESRK